MVIFGKNYNKKPTLKKQHIPIPHISNALLIKVGANVLLKSFKYNSFYNKNNSKQAIALL